MHGPCGRNGNPPESETAFIFLDTGDRETNESELTSTYLNIAAVRELWWPLVR